MITAQWKSIRASQRYPFSDTASCISDQKHYIPLSFILDINISTLPIEQAQEDSYFFVSAIYSSDSFYSIQICHSTDKENPCLKCIVPKQCDLQKNDQKNYFIFTNVYPDTGSIQQLKVVNGSCYFGLTKQQLDDMHFTTQNSINSAINSSCIRTISKSDALQGIRVGQKVLSGIVTLVGQEGILLSVLEEKSSSGDTLYTINFQLDKEYLNTLWQNNLAQLQQSYTNPIRTINNVSPDTKGNISISGLDCVEVEKAGLGVLTISNTCATPCCNINADLPQIEKGIQLLQQQHQILKTYFINQAANINFIQSNLTSLISTN